MPQLFKTPILFLVFNRPDTTQRVFAEIMKVNPAQLFIAQDGPRKNKPGETERCRQVREIFRQANPDCAVKTLFRENNLGCREAIGSSVTWFFQNVEEGIILEDDCLPHPDFFRFCREMLERYRDNEEIMHISGDNFNFGQKAGENSYYFSKFIHIWGWATWQRAWRHYDPEMNCFPEFVRKNRMADTLRRKRLRKTWTNTLEETRLGKIDFWSYRWVYAVWNQNGLAVTPNVNLVSNIGFGKEAAHTTNRGDKLANMKSYPISPITHPSFTHRAKEDEELYRKNRMLSLAERVKNKRKIQTTKVALTIPETIFKLFLSGVNSKLTSHSAYIYKARIKYFFCLLVYKTLGRKNAVKLAEILEPDEE
ncbi:MAG: hypothetical protein ABII89_06185 [Candidatus Omnitrophota bacterium]